MGRLLTTSAIGFAALLSLSACTDPYDPGQRAAGGALLGAGTGAAIGGLAGGGHGAALGALIGGGAGALGGYATTPPPPPPRYYPGY
ncbi:MAG TPA: cell envelope biogenesis protein OmpA [Alphaproteobacteria bacterium]|nr:cell envelope biogenesis protein OmpA [Alphaproteobacteria bacterium]